MAHRSRTAMTMMAVAALVAIIASSLFSASAAGASPVPTSQKPRTPSATTGARARTRSPLSAQAIAALEHATKVQSVPRAAVTAATGKTAAFPLDLSPAVHRLLVNGLGLPLGSKVDGVAYSHYLTAMTGAPARLAFGLPAGYAAPVFQRTAVVMDRRTGTLTVAGTTMEGTAASWSLVIPHAATSALSGPDAVTGAFELPVVTVFGGQVAFRGALTVTGDAVSAHATAYDPQPAGLDGGQVTVARAARFDLSTRDGLTVHALATLGRGATAVPVTLAGRLASAATWSLAATPQPGAGPWQPVAKLTVDPPFNGAVTSNAGAVRFDVRSTSPATWPVVEGTSEHITSAEFSDTTPPVGAGLRPGAPWALLGGDFAVSAGTDGVLVAPGRIAIDLDAGRAQLDAHSGSGLPLSTTAPGASLGAVALHAVLSATPAAVTGSIGGTGLVVDGRTSVPTTLSSSDGVLHASVSGAPATAAAPTTPTVPTTPPVTADASMATGTAGSYSVSSAIYTYLTQTLGLSLPSSTLTGTLSNGVLTVKAGAPTHVVLPLPAGVPTLTFGPVTLKIATATNTLSFTASATTAGGPTATLTVKVVHASTSAGGSTDITTKVTVTNLTVFGVGVTVVGALGVSGTSPSVSLKGTLTTDATLTSGLIVSSGASLSVASGTGLTLSGSLVVGSGSTAFTVKIKGAVTNLSNWSLTVTDPGAPSWQPAPGLVVTPKFSGSVTDTAGTVSFNLATTNTATWQPGAHTTVSVKQIEVSNQKPPKTVSCPGITAGSLWVDVSGQVTYQPSSVPEVSVSGQACIAPATGALTIKTLATGSLTPAGAVYQLTKVALIIKANFTQGTYSAAATATLSGAGSAPNLQVAVAFASDGSFVAGLSVPNVSTFAPGLTGSGAVWVSVKDIPNFSPSSLPGLPKVPAFHLRQGVNVTFTYSVDATERSQLGSWGIPVPATVTAVASLGPTGFVVEVDLGFGAGVKGQVIFADGSGANASAVYLNKVTLGFTLGTDPTVSLGGTATLHLPSVTGDSDSKPSNVAITLTTSFALDQLELKVGVALSGVCGTSSCPWTNAFGIPNLTVGTFAATLGVEFGTGVPTPTLAFSLDNVTLPPAISTPIGLQAGAQISIDVNFDLEAPVVHFGLTGVPAGSPALLPLTIVADFNPQIDPSVLAIDTADIFLAPLGGTLANNQTVAPGVSVDFAASFAGVPVNVSAAVSLGTVSVDASLSIGAFNIGPVVLGTPGSDSVALTIHFGPDGFKVMFSGGFSYDGFGFAATFTLAATTTFLNAYVTLSVNAGLPEYLSAGAYLTGYVNVDGSGNLNVSASGYGELVVGTDDLGAVYFSFSFDGGMAWQALEAAASQVAQAFVTFYGWVDNTVTFALSNLEYGASSIASALESTFAGISPDELASDLVYAANETYSATIGALATVGLSPDQIAGALRDDFALADSTVASLFQSAGYSISQIGSTLQDVYNDGQQAIASVLQGIGADAWSVANVLNQLFTGSWDGSYYLSVTPRGSGGISGAPLFMDVSGGATSAGAQVIDYPWNGNSNQHWYVIDLGGGWAELENQNSGLCLSVEPGDSTAGDAIVQEPCDQSPGVQWYLDEVQSNPLGPSAFLINGYDGNVVDASGASWFSTNLDQWPYNGGWNQEWTLSPGIL